MSTKVNSRRIASFATLLACLTFIILALYAYFVLRRASLQNLIMVILFFGTGVIVEIITLVSKHKGWFARKQDLTKKQNIIMAICAFIFAFCSLWIALVTNIYIFLRTILFIGFLFFSVGSIVYLVKIFKHSGEFGNEQSVN